MKNSWSPTDLALLGLSALVSALVIFGTAYMITGPLEYDLGVIDTVLRVVFLVAAGVGVLALVAAAVAKVIGIGVRSAND